jgi:hypothetical protein
MIKYFNSRVKMLNIFDLKLLQATVMFLTIIIVKLIPRILEINIWCFVVLLVLCLIKPFYVFFFRKV